VLALVLAQREEVLPERVLELLHVKAHVFEGDRVAGGRVVDHCARLWQQDHVKRATLGSDLDLLLEVTAGFELGLVFGVRELLVEDLLDRFSFLGLHRVQDVHGARVLFSVRCGAAPAATTVIVVFRRACHGGEHRHHHQ
jgi:hypothetical protein